jgi:hypothetical protein
MSNSKVSGTPNTIRFYYDMLALFNSVSLRTTYRSNTVKNQEGESQHDDLAISQDEKDIVKEFLYEAAYEIFSNLFKIAEGVATSISVGSSCTTGQLVQGYIVDYDAYNDNVLPAIDSSIENCLRYFVLTKWFKIVGLKDEAAESYVDYRSNLSKMKNQTFQLRKPSMS